MQFAQSRCNYTVAQVIIKILFHHVDLFYVGVVSIRLYMLRYDSVYYWKTNTFLRFETNKKSTSAMTSQIFIFDFLEF